MIYVVSVVVKFFFNLRGIFVTVAIIVSYQPLVVYFWAVSVVAHNRCHVGVSATNIFLLDDLFAAMAHDQICVVDA